MSTPHIAVIGGGPAGAVCSRLLQQEGLSVSVWEGRAEPRQRFPEVLPAHAGVLLQRLELKEFFHSEFSPCRGIVRAWNSPESEKEEFLRPGWIVDRQVLDGWLRKRSMDSGVRWYPEELKKVVRSGDGWELTGQSREESADFLIDATGRVASIARREGDVLAEGDRTVAFGFQYEQDTEKSSFLRVERVSRGWWYFIDQGNATTAVYVTSSRPIPRSSSELLEVLGTSIWASEARDHERGWSPLRSVDATPRSRVASGDGWLAVGDAAASYDPISSQGLMNAMSSAWFGARALLSHLNGEAQALDTYAAAMHLTWERTLKMQDQVYSSGEVMAQSQALGREGEVTEVTSP